jgi:hypothetical protein
MARINSARYFGEIIDAFEVDDDYGEFKKDVFSCTECDVKVQFNRGINHNDLHFKNWPQIEHLLTCGILINSGLYSD